MSALGGIACDIARPVSRYSRSPAASRVKASLTKLKSRQAQAEGHRRSDRAVWVGLAERQCTAMRVRPVAPDDLEACQTIVRGLPDFFTEDVPDRIASDLDAHHG